MYDHAQSPRLGQRTAVESPGVQLVTLETLPEVAYRGQIVYLLDDQEFRVFDGVAWQIPGAAGAQTFIGPEEPVADAIGDSWLNTTNYNLYVWDGTDWNPVVSSRQALTTQASLKLAVAVSKVVPVGSTANIVVTYDTQAPLSAESSDFWVNTVSNEVYRYDGVAWNQVMDAAIAKDIHDAGLERSTNDMRIELFYDSVEPMGLGPADIGDIWTVTDQNNLVKGWTGAQWIDLQVTESAIQDGAVTGDKIAEGTVDAERHVIDGSIVTSKLRDDVITQDKIADYSVPVRKMLTTTHLIY